ncbi:MAG TPA: heavy metal-associated domain-containing protein [Candidatus Pacearchaeota archaeon]|nr:heavy metal-associated domain-containing protein [Candidatus Pacearchaeota archaeon]
MEKSILKVVNIKCGGCEASIISALEKAGLKNISVNVAAQEVAFEGERKQPQKSLVVWATRWRGVLKLKA